MKQIVVVENDASICRVVDKYLQFLGFDVRVARSMEECIRAVRARRPDCVLLDLHLNEGYSTPLYSVLSGLEIPVVMMSMHSEQTVRDAMGAPPAAFVSKPFDLSVLKSTLLKAIQPGGAAS